ncbi:MAG: UDP-2,3-diacylglucosamine diphosphatase [Desulfuromonadales bacterium]
MRALFLADAHLRRPTDPNYQALLAFLDEQSGQTDLLILLGDIFEFWIGKPSVTADHAPFIDTLERLQRHGTKLIYVEGNHDFHLGPVFTERLNCQVLPDGGSVELDGKKIYLAHGDLADARDAAYLRMRKFFRSNLVQGLIGILPRSVLEAIGRLTSEISRKLVAKRKLSGAEREILRAYAAAILASGHQAVVTGHYHRPFHEKSDDGEHIALGDWITQYSYAVYEDQAFTLMHYPATGSSARSPASST